MTKRLEEESLTMTTVRALLAFAGVLLGFGIALAKLPPPPPMDDKAKAAAEEKKAKDAAAAEAAKQQQARAEDRVVARYQTDMKATGKTPPTPQMGPTSTPVAANSTAAATNKGSASSKSPEKGSNAHSDPKTVR
jgi:hypothetical protein